MAKMMAFTDPVAKYTYPASVWLPMVDFGDFLAQTLTIRFFGYASLESLASGGAPIPGAAPLTVVLDGSTTPTVWEFIATDYPGANLFERRANACYAAVEGHPFFADAVDVEISLLPPPPPPVVPPPPSPEDPPQPFPDLGGE
jgi:hypothetical protein